MNNAEQLIEISTDKKRLDLGVINDFLKNHSYWAQTRPLEKIRESIENSLCFGVYLKDSPQIQIGLARVITDYVTFFILADVFIVPEYQNRGLGGFLMQHIIDYMNSRHTRCGLLTTQTAHKFYARLGFTQDHVLIKDRMMIYVPPGGKMNINMHLPANAGACGRPFVLFSI